MLLKLPPPWRRSQLPQLQFEIRQCPPGWHRSSLGAQPTTVPRYHVEARWSPPWIDEEELSNCKAAPNFSTLDLAAVLFTSSNKHQALMA